MEYPKALYKDGSWTGEYLTVQDAKQESQWRAKGFRMLTEAPEEKQPRKRKPKAE